MGLGPARSNNRPNVDWDDDKASNDVAPIRKSMMALAKKKANQI